MYFYFNVKDGREEKKSKLSPYLLDRSLDHLVSVIRLADGPNYGPKYGEEEEMTEKIRKGEKPDV